jgi:hypothetical protein
MEYDIFAYKCRFLLLFFIITFKAIPTVLDLIQSGNLNNYLLF